jgi:hypothetical protein
VHNNTRALTLLCDHPGVQWTVLRFQANVTAWSVTERVSADDEENRIFVIRQVSVYSLAHPRTHTHTLTHTNKPTHSSTQTYTNRHT